jgi:hypothetical protein
MAAAPIVPSYNAGEQGFLNYMVPNIERCPLFEPQYDDTLPPFHPSEESALLDAWEHQPGSLGSYARVCSVTVYPSVVCTCSSLLLCFHMCAVCICI